MGNIPSRTSKLPNYVLRRAAIRDWVYKESDGRITHLLTVRLIPPLSDLYPMRWNERTRSNREVALKWIVGEIDRALLGCDHHARPMSVKVPFISIEECHTSAGQPTYAHFHIAFMVPDSWRQRFDSRWTSKIATKIERALSRLEFIPDIQIKSANERLADYITKNGEREETEIHTRLTLRI